MNKRKKDYIVTGVRREKPDFKKLARALIEVAKQEIEQRDDFIKFLKEHEPRLSIREDNDWTVLELDKLPFAVLNSGMLYCRLSKDICVNEFNIENAEKWPASEDGTIVLDNRNIEEWKKLGLRSLKYATELQSNA